MSVLLVRHGPTVFNGTNSSIDRIRGWLDLPLSEEGQKIAQQVGQQATQFPLRHIFSSDLQRASDTAATMRQQSGVPMTTHPELRPWNLGSLSGQPTEKVMPVIKQLVDRPDVRAPQGESFNEFMGRFLPFITPILQDPRLHGVVTHIRNIKALEATMVGKGNLDRKTWEQVPMIEPGGMVMADHNSFKPISGEIPKGSGAGS